MRRALLLAVLLSVCAADGVAQAAQPAPTPDAQQRGKGDTAGDTVYKADEVDVKAARKGESGVVVKRNDQAPAPFTGKCPAEGTVTLRIVVHKTGKVSEASVVKASECGSFDRRAIERARKLRFTPALKDGRPVSQESEITLSYYYPKGRA